METNLEILMRLIFIYILCEFSFQNKKIIEAKQSNNKTTKYVALAIHSLLYAIFSYVSIMKWQYWIAPITIFITHFVIDILKYNSKNHKFILFMLWQILHITVLIILWAHISSSLSSIPSYLYSILNNRNVLITIIAYLWVLKPTSIMLNIFFSRWNVKETSKGLENAGKWIGYFERTLILTSVLSSQFEMLGFLIAAKSIFRFGEFKQAKEIKITEYILIGTFASFTVAIITGYIAKILFI